MTSEKKRIIFVGDELVAGLGDARALGWTGRVMSHTSNTTPITHMTLPMPGEKLKNLFQRVKTEVAIRKDKHSDNRLVIGIGSHEIDDNYSSQRSCIDLVDIVEYAEKKLGMKTLIVGPPPRKNLPAQIQQEYVDVYKKSCLRRNIPFVDTYTPLVNHEQWNTDMSLSHDGYTPHQAGYALMAWLVLHSGWGTWLGVETLLER